MRIWGVLATGKIPKPPRKADEAANKFSLGAVERAAWVNAANQGSELCVSEMSPGIVGLG